LWRCRTVKNATNQPVVRALDLGAVDTDPDRALALEDEDAEADRDLEVAAGVKEVIQGQDPGPGLIPGDQAGTLGGSEVILEVDLEVDPRFTGLEAEPEATQETDPSQEVETEGVKLINKNIEIRTLYFSYLSLAFQQFLSSISS